MKIGYAKVPRESTISPMSLEDLEGAFEEARKNNAPIYDVAAGLRGFDTPHGSFVGGAFEDESDFKRAYKKSTDFAKAQKLIIPRARR